MYTVIGQASNRSLRVMWTLEELGQPYEVVQAAPQSDAVRDYNPSGKVPILLDDGEAIADSVAIMTYLADKHGGLTHPAGTLERARQDALTHMILDELDAVLWVAARHSIILPEEHRVPDVKPSLRWEFEKNFRRLAARLDGPFLMGDQITIPDILAVHCLSWARVAKFVVEDRKFLDWARGMRARPAYQKALAAG